ncbi:MAG: hypothetical protein K2W82_07650 [Candidatus Obscuribacterales bacterium]|nr:hypothetical protein [Candidatus Obscuribacterales bacterium]
MVSDDIFAAELAEAEAKLAQTEETLGKDDIKVSYCLDKVAEMLRSKKIRTLDAANMEARAKAIRAKHHQGTKAATTEKQQQIAETIKRTSEKQHRQRKNKKRMQIAAATIFVLGAAQPFVLPTAEEKKAVESLIAAAKNFKPNEMAKSFMDKNTDGAKAAAAQQQAHNDEIDQYIDESKE